MIEGMTIQVLTGEDRPVIVKTASTPAAREALRREVDRLRRAQHPGVVEIVSSSDDRLEVGWIGAHTLETARLAVPTAAAVLAAVAETVADLHSMGIVHGRLDPSHVVLAGDGRPVLCGMVGPDPGDLMTGPADDVAALGHLIDHLLGPEADPEPIPERRWSRRTWSGYHRRALQTLADRATHDDPARRPTARALANAIVESVPEARLRPTAPGEVPHPTTSARAEDDPLADSPVDDDPVTEDRSAVEAAEGSGDPLPHDWLDPLGLDPYVREPSTPDAPALGPTRPRTILGLRVEDDPEEAPDEIDPPRPEVDAFWSEVGTTPRSPVRAKAKVLAGAAVLIALVLLAREGGIPTDDQHRPAVSAAPVTSSSTGASSTATVPPGSTSPEVARTDPTRPAEPSSPSASPEVSGADAPDEAPRVVRAGITYAIGQPGDSVGVADWDCDGTPTPGVVRPTTGEVFLFDRWATPGEPLVSSPSLIVPDARALAPPADASGCTPSLLLADGRSVPLVASRSGDPLATIWVLGEEVEP